MASVSQSKVVDTVVVITTAILPSGLRDDRSIRFSEVSERNRQTDRQTDRQLLYQHRGLHADARQKRWLRLVLQHSFVREINMRKQILREHGFRVR